MSLSELSHDIQIGSLTSYIISISAQGKVAADAEATANAVAHSYISYIGSPSSPAGHLSAQLLESATSVTGSSRLKDMLIAGILGGIAGVLIGVIVSLAISRSDPRLRERDQIANSIRVPVLASIPAAHPIGAAGWAKFLEDYNLSVVHAWRLRKALQQLELVGHTQDVSLLDGASESILVLSLSSDPGALAVGPQLAVFAASLGIPTVLAIGPQQDVNTAATLRTACAAPASPKRPGSLRVIVCNEGETEILPGAALTVVVAVVDERAPRIPDTMRTTSTILGVSAGAATAEQLARVAVNAASDGREIVGIIVANPEPADNTTGQIPQAAQPIRRRRSLRLNSITTEIRR
jgi:hypothetical protein